MCSTLALLLSFHYYAPGLSLLDSILQCSLKVRDPQVLDERFFKCGLIQCMELCIRCRNCHSNFINTKENNLKLLWSTSSLCLPLKAANEPPLRLAKWVISHKCLISGYESNSHQYNIKLFPKQRTLIQCKTAAMMPDNMPKSKKNIGIAPQNQHKQQPLAKCCFPRLLRQSSQTSSSNCPTLFLTCFAFAALSTALCCFPFYTTSPLVWDSCSASSSASPWPSGWTPNFWALTDHLDLVTPIFIS
jgi:hypothetical protein